MLSLGINKEKENMSMLPGVQRAGIPGAPVNQEREMNAALGTAVGEALIPKVLGTAGTVASNAAPGVLQAMGPAATAGSGILGAMSGAGGAMASLAPMLGPLAIAALPFMFKQGTEKVKKKESHPSYMDMASSSPIFKTYGPRLDYHAAKQNYRRAMPSGAWADHDDIEMIFELSPEDEHKLRMGIPLNKGTANVAGINPMKYGDGSNFVKYDSPTPMSSEDEMIRDAYADLTSRKGVTPMQASVGMIPTPYVQPHNLPMQGFNHGTSGVDPTIRIDPLVYGGPTDPRRFEGIYDGPTDPRRFEGIYDGPTDPNNFVFNGPMASPFTGSAFSDDLIYRNPAGTYRSYSPGNAGTLGGGKGMPVEIVPETPSNGYDMPAMDRRPQLPVGPRNFPFFGPQIPPVRDFDNLPFHDRIRESPLPPAAGESSFIDRMKEKFLKPYPSGDLDYLIPSLGGIAGPMSGGPSSNSEPSERRSSFMDKMKENFLRLSPYILDQVGPFSGPGGGVAGPMSGGPSSKKQLDSFKVQRSEQRADELHDAKLYDMMMKRNKAD